MRINNEDKEILEVDSKEFLWLPHKTAPTAIMLIGEQIAADEAYKLIASGTFLAWQGDFYQAKQMLDALAKRFDKKIKKNKNPPQFPEDFHAFRMRQGLRSALLSRVLIPFNAGYEIPLKRAPNVCDACVWALGELKAPALLPLRDLQGIIGAFEWYQKGVFIKGLEARVHPHYGVFAPIRNDYLELVHRAQLPEALRKNNVAFDIGCGTGVLAAMLAKRGVEKIIATDSESAAVLCAEENIHKLDLKAQIKIIQQDLFPVTEEKASLIICNPPWLPGKAANALEAAIYDEKSAMLQRFILGAQHYLWQEGEVWLLISNLAEHLGLRKKDELLTLFARGNLQVLERLTIKATHPKVEDLKDPLYAARALEITSLWRLKVQK